MINKQLGLFFFLLTLAFCSVNMEGIKIYLNALKLIYIFALKWSSLQLC